MSSAEEMLARIHAVDDEMVAAGAPAISPRWWKALDRFYRSGRRTLVVRKGRRVGASSIVAPRVAVATALTPRVVPPGEVVTIALLSVRRDEAANRLRNIEAVLDTLHVQYRRSGEMIELRELPVVFSVMTASFRTAVGDTCAMIWADEVARWWSDDHNANPAQEVIGSIKPSLATVADSKLFLVSSPWSTQDYHAECFDRGDSRDQCVEHFTTWEANPKLSEQDTHELEPDGRVWAREYAAEPGSQLSAAFDAKHVAASFREVPEEATLGEPVEILDPSSGGADEFTWGTVCAVTLPPLEPLTLPVPAVGRGEQGRHGIALASIDGAASFWGQETGAQIVERVAASCKEWGVQQVFSDQRERTLLDSELPKHKLAFREVAWTNSGKRDAVMRLRRLMSDGLLFIEPEDKKLRSQLISYTERLNPSGSVTYQARGSGHDDRVALLVTAAMVDLQGWLPGGFTNYTGGRVGRGDRLTFGSPGSFGGY